MKTFLVCVFYYGCHQILSTPHIGTWHIFEHIGTCWKRDFLLGKSFFQLFTPCRDHVVTRITMARRTRYPREELCLAPFSYKKMVKIFFVAIFCPEDAGINNKQFNVAYIHLKCLVSKRRKILWKYVHIFMHIFRLKFLLIFIVFWIYIFVCREMQKSGKCKRQKFLKICMFWTKRFLNIKAINLRRKIKKYLKI